MEQPLFEIIFTDNTIFKGNSSYYETGWLDIAINKPIKRIFYRLPNNDYLCLEGYDSYFRMSEACKDLTGKNKGKVRLQYDYIMGKKENKVTCYRITLEGNSKILECHRDNRYKTGDITTRIFDINDKFPKGLNPDNWRGKK